MNTNCKSFGNQLAALGAHLRRVSGVDTNRLTTSTFRLVRQETDEHSPGRIGDTFGQMFISNHPFQSQFFEANGLVLGNKFSREFVEKVFPLISNFFVGFSDKDLRFLASIRSFLSSGEFTVFLSKRLLGLSKVSWILDVVPVAVCQKRLNPYVDPNLFLGIRKFFSWDIIARKRHEPFAGRSSFDRDCFNDSFDRSGQPKFEFSDLFDCKNLAFEFPTCLYKSE